MVVSADREAGIWSRIDAAAFGLIYGAISALSLLMAFGAHPEHPFKKAEASAAGDLDITPEKTADFINLMKNKLSSETTEEKRAYVTARLKGVCVWHRTGYRSAST